MQQNSEANFVGLSLAYLCFCSILMILLTVNFSKITLIIVKHFKVLTNTISRLRLGDSKPSATNC